MKRIEVTAEFEVSFYKNVTDSEFAELQSGDLAIEDLVDESEAYAQISTGGDCELAWDFNPATVDVTEQRSTRRRQ